MAVNTLWQNEKNVKEREERRKHSPYVGNKNTKLIGWEIRQTFFGAYSITGVRSDNKNIFRAQLLRYIPSVQKAITDRGIIKVKDEDGKLIPG